MPMSAAWENTVTNKGPEEICDSQPDQERREKGERGQSGLISGREKEHFSLADLFYHKIW